MLLPSQALTQRLPNSHRIPLPLHPPRKNPMAGTARQQKKNELQRDMLKQIKDFHSSDPKDTGEKFKENLDKSHQKLLLKYLTCRVIFLLLVLPLSILGGAYTRLGYIFNEAACSMTLTVLIGCNDCHNKIGSLEDEERRIPYYKENQLEIFYIFCNGFWVYLIRSGWFLLFDSYFERVDLH